MELKLKIFAKQKILYDSNSLLNSVSWGEAYNLFIKDNSLLADFEMEYKNGMKNKLYAITIEMYESIISVNPVRYAKILKLYKFINTSEQRYELNYDIWNIW